MGRGRQKGVTKNVVTIKDPLFGKYEIQEDDLCYILIQNTESGPDTVGYYTTLANAVEKIAHCFIVSENKKYTLGEYIKEYRRILDEFKQALKL